MANLKAQTENAKANAKGFVADGVVTYDVAKDYKSQGYEFCMRTIKLDPQDDDPSVATERELFGIMSTGKGGGALSLMPLVEAVTEQEAATDAANLLKRLEVLGIPLNITLWLDEESLKELHNSDEARIKTYRDEWTDFVIKAGYSAGYYKGGLCDCSCTSTSDNGSTVLEAPECGVGLNGHTLKTVSIGENSGTCKIRWAYLS
ncbi:hypothetical protein [Marinomonas mediterranea]|uniref:Uncharacterized protein n=1 Tax=Marinomonas mediterranea (strain ATCC 700492 / JCM 21426 / NBRC 103028 / MMB-1) TaxID=717774 RepID=F2JYA9_MARM1|nr:hypothetical protein [Marinomonas mediterranea]ADZ91940.1 hypothetical protein Marme_2710 [Marinomonas mediterranea MMB-1]WCN09893.1 hypothetical protein GV055_13690 [Marinomonas mediterranea]WCN13973.1 hypothetical protein GV054_13680 [Marinomonas mediterranea]WCN18023.1 hypothetical protein GV053_13705 [Marinomonas mediterranea MMB-1]